MGAPKEYPSVKGEMETLDAIIAGKSIARYGDGELNNTEGKKCVPQMVVPGLADELREILMSPGTRCIVGIPYVSPAMNEAKQRSWAHYTPRFLPYLNAKKPYYSAFITRPDSAPWICTQEYFDKIESLWRDQEIALVWGGYRSLYPEFLRTLGAKKVHSVLCSYEDSYSQIDDLMTQVRATGAKRAILCAGPCATVMAHRLAELGIHAIDLGHIGLMWRHGLTHDAIKITSVEILPAVEVTKAQIKQLGRCSERPYAGSTIWWSDVDLNWRDAIKAEERQLLNGAFDSMPAGRACIVVGAGGGPIVRALSQMYDRVYAYEPDFGLFGSLRRNVHKWGLKNVWFYKEALGDKVGITRMRPEINNWVLDINGDATVMQTTIDAMELKELDAVYYNVDRATQVKIQDGAIRTVERLKGFAEVVL